MNKIDCAKETNRILDLIENHFNEDIFPILSVQPECTDAWDADHSVFQVNLMEEDYRDYDLLKRDIVDFIATELKNQVIVLYNGNYPQSGYCLRIHEKSSGLWFECELHRVENGKPV